MRKEHNKLVRDFIPQIIERNGRKAHIRILNEKEIISRFVGL